MLAAPPTSAPAATVVPVNRLISPARGVIAHVIFIVQENRSFNNLFMGFPGAFTRDYGRNARGHKIYLHQTSLAQRWDIDHSFSAFQTDYDGGRVDGWDDQAVCCTQPRHFAYAYVRRSQVRRYWEMAEQYVLADNTFASNLDGSYVAHQYTIAAYAHSAVNYPSRSWGCFVDGNDRIPTLRIDRKIGRSEPVCQNYATLGDELDAAGIGWRYYTSAPGSDVGGLWTAYGSIDHIYNGPDWASDVITPQSQFIADVDAGRLAAMTWITPTGADSDHPGNNSKSGPDWVAALVNAVGESRFWDSSIIFVLWDDWGGWFDPATPPYADYDGLGFRIPLIMISPYAKAGVVTHSQYETTSVLRFAEDLFGVASLAAADRRASDPAFDPAFNFFASPRAFEPFQTGYRAARAEAPYAAPPVGGD